MRYSSYVSMSLFDNYSLTVVAAAAGPVGSTSGLTRTTSEYSISTTSTTSSNVSAADSSSSTTSAAISATVSAAASLRRTSILNKDVAIGASNGLSSMSAAHSASMSDLTHISSASQSNTDSSAGSQQAGAVPTDGADKKPSALSRRISVGRTAAPQDSANVTDFFKNLVANKPKK